METENDKTYLIVSPGGSVRDTEDESSVTAAIEIKCPYPGKKTYTTPDVCNTQFPNTTFHKY